ncbi:MAG: FHA domain-containing protein [Caldilineaceae bacterium]
MNIYRLICGMCIVIMTLASLSSAGWQRASAQSAPSAPIHMLDTQAAPAIYAQTTDSEASADTVTIPGLQVAAPRAVLVWSLPVLLLLIGYLLYSERRASRRKQRSADQSAVVGNPLFELYDDGQPADSKRHQPNIGTQNPPAGHKPAAQPSQSRPAASSSTAGKRPTREEPQFGSTADLPTRPKTVQASPAKDTSFWDDDDDLSDELTMLPQRPEDDEATYRVREVERPLIGHLVRATSDPNLPREVPIYSLIPAPGERRQIHIGRHSKNNTVVINDPRVSREHAVMIQRDDRLYLRDNGSSAGTFLNWKRLNPGEELLLRHNDLISFGEVAYELQLQSEKSNSND